MGVPYIVQASLEGLGERGGIREANPKHFLEVDCTGGGCVCVRVSE